MARNVVNEDNAPLYPSRDGDHPLAHLACGTEVGTIGDPVAGPPGHGPLIEVHVVVRDLTGWIYEALLDPLPTSQ